MYKQFAAAAALLVCSLADPSAGTRSTMKLELFLPRDLYLTGEDISLDIQLTNTGTAAVDAPRTIVSERRHIQPSGQPAWSRLRPGSRAFHLSAGSRSHDGDWFQLKLHQTGLRAG